MTLRSKLPLPAQRPWQVLHDKALHPVAWLCAGGIALLTLVGWVTFYLSRLELQVADQGAQAGIREIVDTYEAQVVRAVHEIERSLRVVSYAAERTDRTKVFETLQARGLLPPSQLFDLSIVDDTGAVVSSSNGPSAQPPATTKGAEVLRSVAGVELVWPRAGTGDSRLRFRLALPASAGGGAVQVDVDASFFVSNYDAARLGPHGLLALVDTSGRTLVRRQGDGLVVGDARPEPALTALLNANRKAEDADAAGRVAPVLAPWDGVRRYLHTQALFGQPLAVVVGLDEQALLSVAHEHIHTLRWRALIAATGVLVVTGMLGRLYWRLAKTHALARQARQDYAAEIEKLAFHDGLTGLPNRRLFDQLLHRHVDQAARYGHLMAVMYLDLDGFKAVNDTLGHQAGDQLLREVAGRLSSCLRESDVLSRQGGDEFALFLPQLEDEVKAAAVAQRINDAVALPFHIQAQECRVTTSIGIALYPHDGAAHTDLVRSADAAMYAAKNNGKNTHRFHAHLAAPLHRQGPGELVAEGVHGPALSAVPPAIPKGQSAPMA